MGQRMDRNQVHVEMMGRRHASERLAMFLHSVSERFRELGKSADEFSLPMSREDIASYLGMVIETVSRTFSRFQDDGIISVRGRQLRILDHKRLSQLVHEPEERRARSEEHTSELQSLMRISYAVFCLKKKKNNPPYATSKYKSLI